MKGLYTALNQKRRGTNYMKDLNKQGDSNHVLCLYIVDPNRKLGLPSPPTILGLKRWSSPPPPGTRPLGTVERVSSATSLQRASKED
jgi:hypothetical protein